uniref:Uncharacterized protein n=1 Tax=Meloidogyne incognita TaxID=6306 RepID=A0A914N7Z5_MELIC
MEGIQVSPRDVQILAVGQELLAPGIQNYLKQQSMLSRWTCSRYCTREYYNSDRGSTSGPIFTDKIVFELVKTELQVNSTQEL